MRSTAIVAGRLGRTGTRSNSFFDNPKNRRTWLNAADAFGKDSNGNEVLSAAGEQEIDQVIGANEDSVIDEPIVVEGYSNQAPAANEMVTSRFRSLIFARYLEKRFHLSPKNIGMMPLNATAPLLPEKTLGMAPVLCSSRMPNDATTSKRVDAGTGFSSHRSLPRVLRFMGSVSVALFPPRHRSHFMCR